MIEYSNDIKDVCSNIEVYNIGKEQKVSKVFDNMIADMISNKELHPTVTELLIKDNTTLPLDNTLRFQKTLLEDVYRVIMTIDDKIRDAKLQYDNNKAAAKISTLS